MRSGLAERKENCLAEHPGEQCEQEGKPDQVDYRLLEPGVWHCIPHYVVAVEHGKWDEVHRSHYHVQRKGKRNEPAYVIEVAKKIAELKGISYEDVLRITTGTAQKVFSISLA